MGMVHGLFKCVWVCMRLGVKMILEALGLRFGVQVEN